MKGKTEVLYARVPSPLMELLRGEAQERGCSIASVVTERLELTYGGPVGGSGRGLTITGLLLDIRDSLHRHPYMGPR